MKRILPKIVMLIFALTFVFGAKVTVFANTNTSPESAIDISDGKESPALKVANKSNQYYYVYKAPASGYVTFTQTGYVTTAEKTEWILNVYNSQSVSLIGNRTATMQTTPEFMVQKDTVYYLSLKGANNGALNATVTLKANFTANSKVETENNNSMQMADPLVAGTEYMGTIESKEDVDYYQFTATANGYVKFAFSFKNLSDFKNCSLAMNIYDKSGKKLTDFYNGSSRTSASIPIAKGETYYIELNRAYDGLQKLYTIKAIFTPHSYVEKEYNDLRSTATALVNGKNTYGGIYINGDVDYYYFKAPNNGMVYFDFGPTQKISDKYYWEFTIYSLDGKELYSKRANSLKTNKFMLKKNTIYYVRVKDYLGTARSQMYRIKPIFTTVTYAEKEKNNTIKTATSLKAGKKYYGILGSASDVDFYKIKAPKDGYVTFTFRNEDMSQNGEANWNFAIYSTRKSKLFSVRSHVNKKNNITNACYVLKKGEVVYFAVSNYKSAVNTIYSLNVKFKAAPYVEKEINNYFKAANKLKIGKTYLGTLCEVNTSDYFVMQATANKKYKVTLSIPDGVTHPYKIKIYNSNQVPVKTSGYIYKKGTVTFKAKKGKKYYIEICHGRDEIFGRTLGALYKLNVK